MRRARPKFLICVLSAVIISVLLTRGLTASEKILLGYRDFPYPEDTGSNSRPSGDKPESKLWFNDGVWWGVLWSTTANAYRIHRLDRTTQAWLDTGTTVDARSNARVDVGWDGTHLYVVSHIYSTRGTRDANCFAGVNNSNCGKLFRFSYNTGTNTYTLDSGIPTTGANVRSGRTETLVLAKDTTGQLWVTYVENNQVMVNYSLNDGLTWATPLAVPGGALEPTSGSTATDDIAAIIAYEGHVGVMWGHQRWNNLSQPARDPNPNSGREASDSDHLTHVTMHFAVHDDGQPPSSWSSTVIYTSSGDDHISVKAYDGHVYAAIKTDKNAKQIELLACAARSSGCRKKSDWRHYPVFKTKENSGNSAQAKLKESSQPSATRPILLIDTGNRDLYVFASVEQFEKKSINYKRTKLDAIKFDPKAPGVPFIQSTTDVMIDDPTSTKQNLNSTTGLVVLATDEESFSYFHNDLALTPR